MKTILALLALSITTTTFAADLTMTIRNTVTLVKIGKDVFEKKYESSVIKTVILSNGVPKIKVVEKFYKDRMTYTLDESLLRIQDEKDAVDVEMSVIVDRNLFGKLRTFTVPGEKLERAYKDSLEKNGILSLAQLDLKSNERKSLVVGNQACRVASSGMELHCEQETTLNVTNNGAILTAALFIHEVEL